MEAKRLKSTREESGIAIVVTVLLLLLVSAIGISALNRAGDERTVATASRRQLVNLAAAEAGLRLVQEQLFAGAGSSIPPSTPLNRSNMFPVDTSDPFPANPSVRSGVIGDTTPQAIEPIGSADSSSGGNELRIGGGGAAPRLIYRVNVTATDPSGGNSQVQAQFSVRVDGAGKGTY